ncbi:MAG: ABC transporter permease [Deltaproteobacteria bacterium]|nr:ABC transporter permease [Deltaproteobacteria bacterium]
MTERVSSVRSVIEKRGATFLDFLTLVGGIASLGGQSLIMLFRKRLAGREFIDQFVAIGNRSFSIVSVIAIFTGMVIALQLAVGLGRFGLKLYIGQIVGLSIFRELGPVLTSLMIAARVGSGIAAEVGSMVVTEQVLAIEAMGASPIQKLVVPRMLATMIAAPLLTVIANVIGTIGGGIVTCAEAGVTVGYYIDQVRTTVLIEDFFTGLAKSAVFGFLIAIIACYHGLATTGGTEGVGKATTRAVVHASIMIFIFDFVLTKLFFVLLET